MVGSALRRVCLVAAFGVSFTLACGDDDTGGATLDVGGSDAGMDAVGDVGADAQVDASDDIGSDGATDAEVTPDTSEPLDWCDGATVHLWDPLNSTELEFFPDGIFMREDETSPTGWRLDYGLETPWIANAPALLLDSLAAMYDLSGFGTLGGALLRFSEPVNTVPSGEDASLSDPGWQWVRIDTETPERVPFEARFFEDGRTVVLWPLVSLALDAEYALVVTRDALADDGDCIAPSATTQALLHGVPGEARLERFAPTYRAAIETLGIAAEDVAAISVYRTHNDVGPVLRAAADVVEQPAEWGRWGGCEPYNGYLACETSTTVLDYRDDDGLVDDTIEPVEAPIPVSVWMPDGEGPWPVVVYGHGLNSERDEGREIADRLVPEGAVVVSMEAVEHGEHPSVDPDSGDLPALRFLGIDLNNFLIDALAIRGNFNQTNLDRLRLIELLRSQPDLDGDGVDDIVSDKVTYLGASLGALCGAGLLALPSGLDAAVLSIGGARLLSIVTESNILEDYEDVITFVIGSEVLFDRLVPVAQHVVDPADPGLWASHVLRDRFDENLPPSLLVHVGMYDEIVPPGSGFVLARTLGIAHLAPVAVPVDTVEVVEGPVSGNIADGQRTAAYFQMDRSTRRDGGVQRATHTETAKSNEAAEQIRAFFEPWVDDELPVVIDPYVVLDTPPLEE